MRKKFDMFENFARGYPFGKEEDDWLSSPFGETPASPYFEEDAIQRPSIWHFQKTMTQEEREIHSNPSFLVKKWAKRPDL